VLFYADTHNVVENGQLIDRFCDPGDAKVNYLAQNTGTGALEEETFFLISYSTPADEPIHDRVTVGKFNYDNFVCNPL